MAVLFVYVRDQTESRPRPHKAGLGTKTSLENYSTTEHYWEKYVPTMAAAHATVREASR